jgi:hypothetical protein
MSVITYSFKCSTDDLEDRLLIEALSKHKKNKTAFVKECIKQHIETDNSKILDEIGCIKEQLNNLTKSLESNQQINTDVLETPINPTLPSEIVSNTAAEQNNEEKEVEIPNIPTSITETVRDKAAEIAINDDENNTPDDEMIQNITECMSQFTNIYVWR